MVRKLRPAQAWPDVTDAVNAALQIGQRRFTTDRLISAVKLLAAEGLVERELLSAAPRRMARKGMAARKRAMEVAEALVAGRGSVTLAQVGAELAHGWASPRPAAEPSGALFGKSVTRPGAHGGDAHATMDAASVSFDFRAVVKARASASRPSSR